MHFATKLRNQIKQLQAENIRYARAIFDAKTRVLGHTPGVSPFDDLSGNEETMPVRNSDQLRAIILALPFP